MQLQISKFDFVAVDSHIAIACFVKRMNVPLPTRL